MSEQQGGRNLPAEIAVVERLPALGTPGYTVEVHEARTRAFERAYPPAEGEQSGREVARGGGVDAGELRTLPEYERPFVDDPRLEVFHPPSGVEFTPDDREIFDAMRPAALQYNVTPRQLAGLAREVMRISAEKAGAVIENAEIQAENDLKAQWGAQFDQVLADAREFLTLHATPNERKALGMFVQGAPGLTIGSLPSIVNLLARAGRVLRTRGAVDPMTGAEMPQPQTAATRLPEGAEGLRAEIRRLEARYPLSSRTRAQDGEIRALYARLYPEG